MSIYSCAISTYWRCFLRQLTSALCGKCCSRRQWPVCGFVSSRDRTSRAPNRVVKDSENFWQWIVWWWRARSLKEWVIPAACSKWRVACDVKETRLKQSHESGKRQGFSIPLFRLFLWCGAKSAKLNSAAHASTHDESICSIHSFIIALRHCQWELAVSKSFWNLTAWPPVFLVRLRASLWPPNFLRLFSRSLSDRKSILSGRIRRPGLPLTRLFCAPIIVHSEHDLFLKNQGSPEHNARHLQH